MNPAGGDRDRMLDAYLDRQLDAAARASFEGLLASDAALRTELDVQQRIDASLRRLFAPPDVEAVLERALQAQATARPKRRPLRRILIGAGVGLAAVIALLAIGVSQWWWDDPAKWPYGRLLKEPQSARVVYRYAEGHDFAPAWDCESDQQLAAAFWQRLGTPLVLMADVPSNVEARGLMFANMISRNSTVMCAVVDGKGVLTVVDKAGRGRPPQVPAWSKLHVFEKTIGGLELYELTPWDHPAMLDLWGVPDVDEAWLEEGARQLEQFLTGQP